jgi:cytochrome c peroxidase
MLNDPPPSAPPGVPTPPRSFFANLFKIPPLWGIKDTAPYFHDNSAKTLEEVAEQYEFFFFNNPGTPGFVFTKQDQADVVAFLRLLR